MHILTRQSIIKGTCPKCSGIDQAFMDPDSGASCIRKVCFQCGHSDYYSPRGFPLQQAAYSAREASVTTHRETRPRYGVNPPRGHLTVRERMIAGLVADGCNNAEIRETLALSKSAMSQHISSLYHELEATSRTDLEHKARALLLSA